MAPWRIVAWMQSCMVLVFHQTQPHHSLTNPLHQVLRFKTSSNSFWSLLEARRGGLKPDLNPPIHPSITVHVVRERDAVAIGQVTCAPDAATWAASWSSARTSGILRCVRRLGKKEFTLQGICAFKEELRDLHPKNRRKGRRSGSSCMF